jgi:hypothetical protein
MDRFQELLEKRDTEGLSGDEANELGMMEAERRGAEYHNAENPPPDVEAERVARTDVTEEDVEQARDREDAEQAETAPKGSERRPEEEDRAEAPKPGTEGSPHA